MPPKSKLSAAEQKSLLALLKERFEKNMKRHEGISWTDVEARLLSKSDKLHALWLMENSGGEPDVLEFDKKTGEYIFYDCAAESPAGRRSLCYDKAGLDSRKEFKPENNAVDMAAEMGAELLDEEQYKKLQEFGPFDQKTSSWILTPADVRKLGGSIFGDFRFGRVFIYHNGPQSYYGGRGFRCLIRI